jgi:tetratricopeptide (TPR) repeat protein
MTPRADHTLYRRNTQRARALPLIAAGLWLATSAHAQTNTSVSAAPATDKTRDPGTDLAQHCFERAQVAYFEGRLAEARRDFECAFKHIPSPEMAWNLARVNERMGEVEDGVRYFREYLATAKITARERKRVQARIQALIELGQRQSATLKLDADEQRHALGEEARAFFERGTKLYASGHYKAAAAAFTAALQLSDAPELHYNLAVTSERLGEPADALDHYRAYLDALPEAPDRAQVLARLDALRSDLR